MSGEWKSTQSDVFNFENEGDTIEGKLVNIRDGNYLRQNGEKSKVYDLETSEGTKTVFGTSVIERAMGAVAIGQQVKITYQGTTQTKNGRPVKLFDVFYKD